MNNELILKEVEVTKVNLQPRDVLMVTVKSNEVTEEAVKILKQNLTDLFPDNKIVVFAMGTQDSVEFTIASEPEVSYPIKEQGEEE